MGGRRRGSGRLKAWMPVPLRGSLSLLRPAARGVHLHADVAPPHQRPEPAQHAHPGCPGGGDCAHAARVRARTCGDFSRSISFCIGPSMRTKSSRPRARHVSLVCACTVAMLQGGAQGGMQGCGPAGRQGGFQQRAGGAPRLCCQGRQQRQSATTPRAPALAPCPALSAPSPCPTRWRRLTAARPPAARAPRRSLL